MSTMIKDKIVTFPFGDSFLDRLGTYIETHFIKKGQDLSRLAIVFGGKRPSLFLKRDLASRIRGPYYPPQFYTIDEFMAAAVLKKEPFGPIKDLDGCYWLYELARQTAPEILKGRETFAGFMPWTREILRFIDQLDLEFSDNQKLLHIQANAEIGYPVPEDINRLLQHIVKLRLAYHRLLKEKALYSRGFQYLRAAELIDNIAFDEFDQIIFCNFFYFHRSEEVVVKSLYNRDQTLLVFQGDERKWPVLHKISKDFACSITEGDELKDLNFNLELFKGFDAHSQMGLVRRVLEKIKTPEKTVIVLPNPDQIVPLLSEISDLVDDFNISMGYPLKRSSLYTLFEYVFKAQFSRKDSRYYAKDYLKVLRHPFVKNLKLSDDPALTRVFVHKIEEILTGKEMTEISGSLFIELEDIEGSDALYSVSLDMLKRLGFFTTRRELESILKDIHGLLFESWEGMVHFHDFAASLEKFLDVFVEKSFLKNYPLNLNIAEKMYAIKDELSTSAFNKEKFSPEDVFRIFDGKVAQEFVAFHGEPLKGLQILGLLETRALNFENVIVLDVNEGILPKLRIYEPLIPRDVMIGLNLDRLEWEEEIQRYQFMRLISSAKNVYLIYQEGRDKEKSRFVEELIWEEEKRHKKLQVVPVAQAKYKVKISSKKKSVPKTAAMADYLKTMRYSASSLNMYLKNPLEFYYNYVLRLQESEDLLDEPEARHVGTFIHEVLEKAYTPFLKKTPELTPAFYKRFDRIFEEHFAATFAKSMKSDAFLLKSVMADRLKRLLDNERDNPVRQIKQILYLENRFEETIPVSVGPVRFKYIVDRVDELQDGTIMIVDYKTGFIDQMPKAIGEIAALELSREAIRENVKSFQIPLYFHYLNQQFKDRPINAALYNLRTCELHKFVDEKLPFTREQINAAFLRSLDFIISEICDARVPFEEDG